jgi:hypothetical protein
MIAKGKPFAATLAVFMATFFLALWTHPLVMLPAVYLFVFYWLQNPGKYTRRQATLYAVILLVLAGLKFNQGMHHGYDSTKIEVVTGLRADRVQHIFSSPQFVFFAQNRVSRYWLFTLIFIAGIVSLVRERKMLLLTWTVTFAVGYLLLVFITFWDTDANRFYIESEYMPLSIICCTPFVYYLLPKLSRNAAVILLLLVFAIRLVYIVTAAPAFTNRVAIMNGILYKMKEKNLDKAIIPEPLPDVDKALIMNWGAPVESMLLSGINGEKPQRTFMFADEGQLKAFTTASRDTFLGCWEKRPIQHINERYFQFDTTSTYRVISYQELMR